MEPRYYQIDSQRALTLALREIAGFIIDPEYALHIVVRDQRQEKTGDQRKLFHSICSEIGLEVGEPAARIKTAIKAEFYGLDSFVIRGHTYTGIQSTEESDRAEYSRLIDFAYQWAAENGVVIQDRRETF